ncbi:MAG: TIGR01459 family HAD-type hydrolase [Hyphomonadaceae bacterium]|nr:TIGR01459 family HAD-type hydrolase [Hyphomonadaceae bacterium]MBC6412792.1 TIGR01459 family HAD-type hydrolase [Hyphomonadaceae bacterium]
MREFDALPGLGGISGNYDALLCDIWGVVHNGREPYREACAALERFRAERGPVILITNSPRPSSAIPGQLAGIGVPGEIFDAVVTSGDAAINELSRRAPGPAFRLGPERDDIIYEALEMHFSDLEDAAFISCTGLFDDENETPDDYVDLLTEARDMGLSLVCANPDVRVKRGDRIIYCGGALAQLYEKLGGNVVYAGKPHPPIYRLCRAWLTEVSGYEIPRDRVLTVGDNIFTDLLGAQQEDYDCLFVSGGGLNPDKTEQLRALLSEHGLSASYMMPRLVW